MPLFEEYVLPEAEEKPTLAAALRVFLEGKSWAQVRQLISGRRIEVNETLCLDDARRLDPNDVIRVWQEALPKPPGEDAVRIVHCDAHLVVVDKPAGIMTVRHRAEREWPELRKNNQPSLDEMVYNLLGRTAGGKKSTHGPRLRIVQRLDRDTSGLIVFARSVTAERYLASQFKAHTVIRRYLAIIEGQLELARIESTLVRDRGDGLRGSHPTTGQTAITHVAPLEELSGYSLVECRLETGRTHQIRIHLGEQGNRLCGEKVYRRQMHRSHTKDLSGAKRQALHAAELGFIHPGTEKEIRFESEMPDDMRRLWEKLRKADEKKG
ncbi:RluA family pseudouridine synthase [Lignipirellula cremea]|uniref:Ribosomal large subunit pseudouridine synthase D n=1 Tax=Lignipirellula cremea TaxID=2528010 RepID=A0A518E3R4_9BACT|nr:pseudouridine synthase [Lignipirellula cremea]QDU98683.1 Ribosomal large subunit pseudouridine synthase D [Lignipirellula cremea]